MEIRILQCLMFYSVTWLCARRMKLTAQCQMFKEARQTAVGNQGLRMPSSVPAPSVQTGGRGATGAT